MLATLLAVAVAVLLFYVLFIKPMNYWTKRGVKQGKPLWLFGDNWGPLFRLQSVGEMVQYLYNQCPGTKYSGIYLSVTPTLLVKDPELIKQISVKDFDHFTDHRDFFPEDCDPLWCKGLLALKGQPWRNMRTLLTPAYTSNKMKGMFVLMTECADNFVAHLLKKEAEVIQLEMKDTFTRFTNDVIATAAFGVKVDSLAEPNNEFYLMGKAATNFGSFSKILMNFLHVTIPRISKFFKLNVYDTDVRRFFSKLINETITTRAEKGIVRHDMIHLFMQAQKGVEKHDENGTNGAGFAATEESYLGKAKSGRGITNEDITAQALLFLFAGFDSVSGVMCFAAHELAVNPHVQEKLRKEVLATLEECNGELTYDGLLKMKYMDMVVSETMRKWPPFPTADRVCTKPYVIQPATPEERPVHLNKGDVILLPTFAMHYDPKFHPNPDRFDPERFSDENKRNVHPYTYFPFGLGQRNCIGSRFALLETKVVFFYILQHFELVPVRKTQVPLEMSKKGFGVTAANGFWLGLKRIEKKSFKKM